MRRHTLSHAGPPAIIKAAKYVCNDNHFSPNAIFKVFTDILSILFSNILPLVHFQWVPPGRMLAATGSCGAENAGIMVFFPSGFSGSGWFERFHLQVLAREVFPSAP